MLTASPVEVRQVKDALARNANNVGVGVIHVPTGLVHLCPFDSLPLLGGHDELVQLLGLSPPDCRGFVVGLAGTQPVVINSSHLNGPQGQPGSLRMPQSLFSDLEQALRQAGL